MYNTYPGHLIELGSEDTVAIKQIKERLNNTHKDGSKGTLDVNNPLFGTDTVKAVMRFQTENHLNPDGVIGSLTWKKLFSDDAILPAVAIPVVSSRVLKLRAIEVARSFLYVREKTGNNDGVEVESFLHNVGLTAGYAWCQAFVYSNFLSAAQTLGTHNPVPMTAGVIDCWNKTKGEKVTVPQAGDVFIMDFGGGKGHTGHVTDVVDDHVHTIEGNTGQDPILGSNSDREGDGVYERSRRITSFKGFIRYND